MSQGVFEVRFRSNIRDFGSGLVLSRKEASTVAAMLTVYTKAIFQLSQASLRLK